MSPPGLSPFPESRRQAIRGELERLLNSPTFRSSKRCREFLDHVVRHTLDRPGIALKERAIGIDLFGLPPDYDTSQHTIVRVTANEVRKKLAQQYLGEDAMNLAVKIEIPPGSYVAEFRWKESASEEEEPAAQPNRRNWLRSALTVGTGGALVGAGAVTMRWWLRTNAPEADPSSAEAASIPNAASLAGEIRLAAGSASPYVDRSGRTWQPDAYFSGGTPVVRPSERVLRTLDPDLYRHARQGDFRYDIPLPPGEYALHLHFAETALADFISAESSGEGQRLFHVTANGKPLLEAFDVVADAAGANLADERVFRGVTAAEDGLLHLGFTSLRGAAIVSGIELIPMKNGKLRPLRIRSGWPTEWRDPIGESWRADSYFLGGNALVRSTNPARDNSAALHEVGLYNAERWGHFSYALPVAEGSYQVTLKFCEGHYGSKNSGFGGQGSRLFDVFCNGVVLLRNFDISREAGGEGIPLDKVFPGLRPNAQGKLVLSFVPVAGMACLNGIEVIDEKR